MKDRLDKQLVNAKLARTRSQAKQLIKEGVVFCGERVLKKPSELVEQDCLIVKKENIYVGRGAYKLEAALEYFKQDVKDLIMADIGASTGGFTNVLLCREVKKVYAVDVGSDQLHETIRDDSRVISMENTNVRDLDSLGELVDGAVADLSYISLRLVLDKIFSFVKDGGFIITLFKPQFEVGRENLGKNGVVKDNGSRDKFLSSFIDWCDQKGLYLDGIMLSPIVGKMGNVEYLMKFVKIDKKSSVTIESLN